MPALESSGWLVRKSEVIGVAAWSQRTPDAPGAVTASPAYGASVKVAPASVVAMMPLVICRSGSASTNWASAVSLAATAKLLVCAERAWLVSSSPSANGSLLICTVTSRSTTTPPDWVAMSWVPKSSFRELLVESVEIIGSPAGGFSVFAGPQEIVLTAGTVSPPERSVTGPAMLVTFCTGSGKKSVTVSFS